MGSKGGGGASDDPMDLGGFMQNYVLKNPFNKLPLDEDKLMAPTTPPSAAPVASLSPTPSTPASSHANTPTQPPALQHVQPTKPPLPTVTLSPRLSMGGATAKSTENRTTAVTLSASPAVAPSESQAVATAPSNEGQFVGDLDESSEEGDFVIQDDLGMLIDTPKGHVGSNVAYAVSLKQCRVSGYHKAVQVWLWSNYRHVASYPVQLSIGGLSTSVQKEFPHMTNATLSRIMKFTFPNCAKVITKSGYFYRGLVQKPQASDYNNLALLQAVARAKQRCSLTQAAEMFDVDEERVMQMYFYHQGDRGIPVDPRLAARLGTEMTEHLLGPVSIIGGSPGNKTKSADTSATSQYESSPGGVAIDLRPSTRFSSRQRRLSKKMRDYLDEDSMDEDAGGEHHETTEAESVASAEDEESSSNRSAPTRTAPSAVKIEGEDSVAGPVTGVTDDPDKMPVLTALLKGQRPPRRDSPRRKRGRMEIETSASDNGGVHDIIRSKVSRDQVHCVHIKKEMVDPAYEEQGNNPESPIPRGAVASTSGCCASTSVCPSGSAAGDSSAVAEEGAGESGPTVETLKLVWQLDKSRKALGAEKARSHKREEQLTEVQKEASELRQEVRHKNLQLVELARDFQHLHSEFRRVARRFRVVVNGQLENGLLDECISEMDTEDVEL